MTGTEPEALRRQSRAALDTERSRLACAKRRLDPLKRAADLYKHTKSKCKRTGRPFTLSKEEFVGLFEAETCAVTGLPLIMTPEGGRRGPWTPSIDQIENDLGYVPGNVQTVCWAYNLMKGTWSHEDCLSLAHALVRTHRHDAQD